MTQNRKHYAVGLALALMAVVFASSAVNPATADNLPANRMSASGSALDLLTAPLTEGASSEVHTILTGQVRLSSPYDLLLHVTAECALWTDITTVGNDDSEAIASVKLWVEIDGIPVPVAADDVGEEAGKVVFCNRAFRSVTSNFDNENQTIETYLRTRSANAFNWFALSPSLDAGMIHTIEVKAQLDVEVNGLGQAQAGIGKRTLVVEPVRLADEIASF